MANPLAPPEGMVNSRAPFANMAIGETRNHRTINDRTGVDRAIKITRTDRPYAYDLADAYNDSMSEDGRRRGLEWFVTPAGELKLGTNQQAMMAAVKADKARQERERQAFIAIQRRAATES